jgi:ribosomal protein S27AE
MPTIQTIRCPNCGRPAERHVLDSHQLLRTQCGACDYLLITCAKTGKVVEAYAPGIFAVHAI